MRDPRIDKYYSIERFRKSSKSRSAGIDEFYSDKSRIVFSSSFRRLMQKAQVFSLEPNASVRTRMTHSLEVADLGRTLCRKIVSKMGDYLTDSMKPQSVAIVENACLLHDIGNPPFGHFGETAIRDWAKDVEEYYPPKVKESIKNTTYKKLLDRLLEDFRQFDGNPQGFRTITRLHTEFGDEFSMNLTYATLLCTLKYVRCTDEEKGEGILKKAGYFQTEKRQVETIWNKIGCSIHTRSPLTYIMEAADDIAYCMSDIADGIEKHILTEEQFVEAFRKRWDEKYPNERNPVMLPEEVSGFSKDISIPWSNRAITEAADVFMKNYDRIFDGTLDSLITEENPMGKVFGVVRDVSRTVLYNSVEAESIEITGYAVISGIIRHYRRLLIMNSEDFLKLVKQEKNNYEVERRLYNRIGERYVKAYKYALKEIDEKDSEYDIKEWWLRSHLLLDHISGMTDEYALETYQMLEGINLLKQK